MLWQFSKFICSTGLSDCWGEKFEELYTRYEKEGKFRKQVNFKDC